MKKTQKMGLYIFTILVIFAVVFSYLINAQFIKMPEKPWHMQPYLDADSLSNEYIQNFELLDKTSLVKKFVDTSKINVLILIDAWGVPFDMSLLQKDFAMLSNLKHKEYLHKRLANRTRHAELAELRIPWENDIENCNKDSIDSTICKSVNLFESIYLFGGDSLEYGRNKYIDSLGYNSALFCENCGDSIMFNKLDSLLEKFTTNYQKDSLDKSLSNHFIIALTTTNSRDGDKIKLHNTLELIANTARNHPNARFIIQGTHRPILGDPKIRRESFIHWVPAVVIN